MIIDSWPWPCGDFPTDDLPLLDLADRVVQMHDDALASLGAVDDPIGTLLADLEGRGDITSTDTERLTEMFTILRAGGSQGDSVARLEALNDETRAVDDPSLIAAIAFGLALGSVNRARTNAEPNGSWSNGFTTGYTDALGALAGTIALPGAGTLAGGFAASYVAEHLEVSVSWR